MAAADFNNLLTTTMRNYLPILADGVFKANPLTYKLEQLGKITEQGGTTILSGLSYAESQAFKAFSGYDKLPLEQNDFMTRTSYEWKTVSQTVGFALDEQWINAGEHAVLDLVSEKVENAQQSLHTQFERMFLGDGGTPSSANPKEFHGLKHLIGQNTKPVGGIDPSVKPFDEAWASQIVTIPAKGSAYDVNIDDILEYKHNIEKAGAEQVDLIVTSSKLWHLLERQYTPAYRTYDPNLGEQGFSDLMVGKTPVVYTDGPIEENYMYMLNMKYLKLVTKSGMWFTMPKGWDTSVDQMAYFSSIVAMGNLIVTNRKYQGLLIFAGS